MVELFEKAVELSGGENESTEVDFEVFQLLPLFPYCSVKTEGDELLHASAAMEPLATHHALPSPMGCTFIGYTLTITKKVTHTGAPYTVGF